MIGTTNQIVSIKELVHLTSFVFIVAILENKIAEHGKYNSNNNKHEDD